jgi:hypothetical protein
MAKWTEDELVEEVRRYEGWGAARMVFLEPQFYWIECFDGNEWFAVTPVWPTEYAAWTDALHRAVQFSEKVR